MVLPCTPCAQIQRVQPVWSPRWASEEFYLLKVCLKIKFLQHRKYMEQASSQFTVSGMDWSYVYCFSSFFWASSFFFFIIYCCANVFTHQILLSHYNHKHHILLRSHKFWRETKMKCSFPFLFFNKSKKRCVCTKLVFLWKNGKEQT